jgi:hypothetical protein
MSDKQPKQLHERLQGQKGEFLGLAYERREEVLRALAIEYAGVQAVDPQIIREFEASMIPADNAHDAAVMAGAAISASLAQPSLTEQPASVAAADAVTTNEPAFEPDMFSADEPADIDTSDAYFDRLQEEA